MQNKLFRSLNNPFVNQLNQLRSNPVQFLMNRKFNLPKDFNGGPREIVQYFLDSGQVTKGQLDALQTQVDRLRKNFS